MSNLVNLTSKIIAEAKEKAGEITGAAKSEAETAIAREVATAQAEADKLVADAKTEAELTAERIIQGKTLAIRDENLGAKRQMLDKIFDEALNRLNGMPEDEYVEYLRTYLPKLDLAGQTVIVPAKYAKAASKIIGLLPALLQGIHVESGDNVAGGFILVKNGIEQNHTFSALLDYYRYELESEVLKILYA